ncbi:hypothetical protein NKJ88_06275 [Mesorhizobium sp. M0016]|uniref:hypothetical protein n=1 Tax=Mesorhizobium sp. M0016 TaxID=2956843 RepID=UPI00333C14A5
MTPNIDDVLKKVLAYGEARALAADLYLGDGVSKNVRQVQDALSAVREALSPTPPPPDPRQVQMAVAMGRVSSYADARLAARNGSRETQMADEKRVTNARRGVEQYLTVLIQDSVDLQGIRNFAKAQNDSMSAAEEVPSAEDWEKLYHEVIG